MAFKRWRARAEYLRSRRNFRRTSKSRSRLAIQVSDCPPTKQTRFLKHSLPRNQKAAAWGWRSVVRSLSRTEDMCGHLPTQGKERHYISLCRSHRTLCHVEGNKLHCFGHADGVPRVRYGQELA